VCVRVCVCVCVFLSGIAVDSALFYLLVDLHLTESLSVSTSESLCKFQLLQRVWAWLYLVVNGILCSAKSRPLLVS